MRVGGMEIGLLKVKSNTLFKVNKTRIFSLDAFSIFVKLMLLQSNKMKVAHPNGLHVGFINFVVTIFLFLFFFRFLPMVCMLSKQSFEQESCNSINWHYNFKNKIWLDCNLRLQPYSIFFLLDVNFYKSTVG